MTVFGKLRVLSFAHKNRVRFMIFEFLEIVEGVPLINVFLRVFFDVIRQTTRYNRHASKQSSFYVFGVFVHSRGGGTPDKCIPEGLF